MSESNRAKKYTLLCLRVAAECRSLAEDVPTPELSALSSIWPACGRNSRISPRGDTNAYGSFLSSGCACWQCLANENCCCVKALRLLSNPRLQIVACMRLRTSRQRSSGASLNRSASRTERSRATHAMTLE